MADVTRHHIATDTIVRWTINGWGGAQVREGKVLAFVPVGEDVRDVYPPLRDMPANRFRGHAWTSSQDRYLVAVKRPSGVVWLYTPLVKIVEMVGGQEEG